MLLRVKTKPGTIKNSALQQQVPAVGRMRASLVLAAIMVTTPFMPLLVGAQSQDATANTDAPIIGIDLGTTYSCVGVYQNGQVEIIPNEQGNRITPSYVAFTPDGSRLIGDAAKTQLTSSNPQNTVFGVKRLIGRTWDDPTVQKDVKFLPFKVIEKSNKPHIQVNIGDTPKVFTPEEISAMVLGKMRDIAQDYLGQNVTKAVITVPAYFNDAQRRATKDAGTIAGIEVIRILNEPIAASIAYGLDRSEDGEKIVLVFDLGGSTCDVSLLTIDHGVYVVGATNGDTHLGGEDFDRVVMDHMYKVIKKKLGKDIQGNTEALQKLRREVEKAKRSLSSEQRVTIEIDDLVDGLDLSESLSRSKFEELNMELFRSTLVPVCKTLQEADVKVKDVDEIILVGGSTRIPKVQQIVKEMFHGKETHRDINPDEVVAFGAAVHAWVLNGGGDNSPVICDVNPLTLGIETVGGVMTPIINRNNVIPNRKARILSTAVDNQEAVTIQVYEGERILTKHNRRLGRFDLTGIKKAPRGVPQIQVEFEIDPSGLLTVSAKDMDTGKENSITINKSDGGLSNEDIDLILKEAEEFAEEDKRLKEQIEAKNELEAIIYITKKQFSNEEDLEKIERTLSVDETVSWLEANKDALPEEVIEKKDTFVKTVPPITQKLYEHGGNSKDKDEL